MCKLIFDIATFVSIDDEEITRYNISSRD